MSKHQVNHFIRFFKKKTLSVTYVFESYIRSFKQDISFYLDVNVKKEAAGILIMLQWS